MLWVCTDLSCHESSTAVSSSIVSLPSKCLVLHPICSAKRLCCGSWQHLRGRLTCRTWCHQFTTSAHLVGLSIADSWCVFLSCIEAGHCLSVCCMDFLPCQVPSGVVWPLANFWIVSLVRASGPHRPRWRLCEPCLPQAQVPRSPYRDFPGTEFLRVSMVKFINLSCWLELSVSYLKILSLLRSGDAIMLSQLPKVWYLRLPRGPINLLEVGFRHSVHRDPNSFLPYLDSRLIELIERQLLQGSRFPWPWGRLQSQRQWPSPPSLYGFPGPSMGPSVCCCIDFPDLDTVG